MGERHEMIGRRAELMPKRQRLAVECEALRDKMRQTLPPHVPVRELNKDAILKTHEVFRICSVSPAVPRQAVHSLAARFSRCSKDFSRFRKSVRIADNSFSSCRAKMVSMPVWRSTRVSNPVMA